MAQENHGEAPKKTPEEEDQGSNWVDRAFMRLGIDANALRSKGPHFAQVLTTHTVLQAAVTAVVQEAMAAPEHFKRTNLKFASLVHLGLALRAIPEEFAPFLFKVESTRNRLAHERGADVSRADVEKIIDTLPPFYSRFMRVTGEVVGEVADPLGFVSLLVVGQLTGEIRFNPDDVRIPPPGWRPGSP
jgi:hypothetical protein